MIEQLNEQLGETQQLDCERVNWMNEAKATIASLEDTVESINTEGNTLDEQYECLQIEDIQGREEISELQSQHATATEKLTER